MTPVEEPTNEMTNSMELVVENTEMFSYLNVEMIPSQRQAEWTIATLMLVWAFYAQPDHTTVFEIRWRKNLLHTICTKAGRNTIQKPAVILEIQC